ncbi:MAG: TetR family transcriptional regulator [bacterium]|nr:TetR family transcriptional regulator [bacterium]
MSRPQNTQQRRSEIIGGLARVMADRGYAKATIQAIAQEAGLTPGLIHYHFQNKQEILLALIERLASVVRSRLDAEAADPSEKIFAAVDALVGTEVGVETEAVACWVVIGAEAVRQPEVRSLYEALMREAIEEFTNAFRSAMHKEGRSDATAPDAALSLVAAMEGFFRLAAGSPSCVPYGSAATSIKQIARGYLDSAEEAR